MTKPRRKTIAAADDAGAPTFEEALAGLESIVEAMENEQLPLEDLVCQYEKGSKLLERCEAVLQSARDRIELITLRAATDDAETDEESSKPSATPEEPDDDDIRLF
ncbi:MAG: exodeoxyribonuclease VII small subunit [Luteolibacter sp.]